MQIRQVLFGERGNAHLHARQIDALVVADRASVQHFRRDRDAVAFKSAQFDGPIRQQDAVSGLHVAGEIQVTGGGALRGTDQRLRGDREPGAGGQRATSVFETAQADFGTLQVQQNRRARSRFTRRRPNGHDARLVLRLRAVRSVQAKHVHPGR